MRGEVYAATVLSVVSFSETLDLGQVQQTAEWAREVGWRRKDKDMASVPDAHARHAAALRGMTAGWHDLGLASSSDTAFRESLDDASTPVALFYYFFCNAELAYLAGDSARAATLLEEASRRAQGIFTIPTTAELCLLELLVAARRHEEAGRVERAKRFRMRARVRKLDAWARSCPANFEAHALIAHGEAARVRGHHAEAPAAALKAPWRRRSPTARSSARRSRSSSPRFTLVAAATGRRRTGC